MKTTVKTSPTASELSVAAQIMGSKGGLARTKKGLASLPKRRRVEIAMMGAQAALAARRAKRKAARESAN